MRKFKLVIIIVVASLVWLLSDKWLGVKGWDGKNDIRMAIITPTEIGMVVISPERKMVNTIRLDSKVMIWLPGGMGWYQSDRLKKIVDQEKSKINIEDIFFYNFGFLATNVVYLDQVDSWRNDTVLVKQLGGIMGLAKFRWLSDKLIYKEEIISKDLTTSEADLDEMMARDFADNRLLNDEVRVSVINTTEENGAANFIGLRLAWAGFSVVATENSENKVDLCLVLLGKDVETTVAAKEIKKLFKCQVENDSSLGNREIELYIGEKMVSMIKYSSYVRTF